MPFLGGGSVVSRAELNVRYGELMNERGKLKDHFAQSASAQTGLSRNDMSMLDHSRTPYQLYMDDTFFVPSSGHPQYDNGPYDYYRPDGSKRVCRTQCNGAYCGCY